MSSITVEEAMAVGALTRARMIAGFSGLKNPIEHVTVLEIPDSEEWFKGHELIITAFYHIRDDVERQLALLDKMKLMHAAALALCYPGLHYHTLSEQVLQRAEALHIPIIEIPRDVPYIDIISPVVQEIQKHRSLEIKQMLEIQNQLTEWLAQKLDPTRIIPKIGMILGDPLLLIDEQYHQLAAYQINLTSQPVVEAESIVTDKHSSEQSTATNQAELEQAIAEFHHQDDVIPIQSLALNAADTELEGQHYIVETIQSADRVYGYLCAWSEERMPPFKEMLYHSVAVSLALYFSQEDAIQSAARDYQQTILVNWLNGQEITPDQLERSIQEIGYDPKVLTGMALLTACNREQHDELAREVEDWCRSNQISNYNHRRCMIIPHGHQLVLLLEHPTESESFEIKYDAYFAAMHRQISVQHTVMYSRIQHHLAEEGAALYHSLQNVLYFRHRIAALPDVIHAARLPIFQLLRNNRAATLLSPLRPLLQPLLDYDQRMNADFTETLEYFLFYPDQQDLPDVLHIHRNTLNYRKQRIIEILGMNPFENPYRVQFELAVLVHHLA
ncbi:PucR family transcriptional regulator [Paenibacillus wenxiniae]|uniref:PucR family transcriptional regulator n=1 Tax=Paenibacillus wenxiniae TaxID=1636843 RepID=A0ABW4RP29_9BACL